jgi:serine/threonine protein kinase
MVGQDIGTIFREAKALASLDHPAVVKVRHCDYADEGQTRPYLVLEYFEGETLSDYVLKTGRLSVTELQEVARQVLEALNCAHARNILHRDVKPANILLRRKGSGWEVRLIDFGLACRGNAAYTGNNGPADGTQTLPGRLAC